MTVTYIFHSGFAVTLPDVILLFDYYRDPANILPHLLAEHPAATVIFFVSHHHSDHYNPEIFHIAQNHRRIYLLGGDITARAVPDSLEVQWMMPGDTVDSLTGGIRVRCFGSTDAGVSYLVSLSDGRHIFHAGDLNDWHWQDCSTPREVEEADNDFRKITHKIASYCPEIELVMFPVDPRLGTDFARGARLFLHEVKVTDFIPMHCQGDFKLTCDFPTYAPPTTRCHCLSDPGQSITLS